MDFVAFFGVALIVIGVGWFVLERTEAAAKQRALLKASEVIADYFKFTGTAARVECIRLEGKGVVALIEVDSQFRFRNSFIIEQTLREQIQRGTGSLLAEVYWRFPMAERFIEASLAIEARKPPTVDEDLRYYIGEASWEEYLRNIKRKENG